MTKKEIEKFEEVALKEKIFTIRGLYVMLDSDLAELFGVETRILNQAVKRNQDRFPNNFLFQMTNSEFTNWKSQIVISNYVKMGLRKRPFVFTEHGVVMLSSVLRSKTASQINIKIVDAFIEMRKFINSNSEVFQRLCRVEVKLIENDSKFDKVFSALESKDNIPDQGIFFQGQIFDAYKFVSDLFRMAKSSIVIIDNYIDDSVLVHLTKIKKNVKIKLLTKSISNQLKLDIVKFEKQYFSIEIKEFKESHDRFIILDDKIVYHFGASLKDLGKKLFGFSRFEKDALKLLDQTK